MQKIAKNDALFYAFVLSALYISMGPWALGYFLDESLGLLFPWGLWIDGHILPADVTHLYGLVFIFPYLYMLFGALVIYQKRPSWRYKLISNVIFAIVLILQLKIDVYIKIKCLPCHQNLSMFFAFHILRLDLGALTP